MFHRSDTAYNLTQYTKQYISIKADTTSNMIQFFFSACRYPLLDVGLSHQLEGVGSKSPRLPDRLMTRNQIIAGQIPMQPVGLEPGTPA